MMFSQDTRPRILGGNQAKLSLHFETVHGRRVEAIVNTAHKASDTQMTPVILRLLTKIRYG